MEFHERKATKLEIDQLDDFATFADLGKAAIVNGRIVTAPEGYKKIRTHLVLMSSMMGDTKQGWLQEVTIEETQEKTPTQEWYPFGDSGLSSSKWNSMTWSYGEQILEMHT